MRARTTGTLHLRLVPRPDHTIRIAPEPFGCGFDVTVEPVPTGVGHDRELPTYAEAKAYAERLSAAMGWPVLDQVGSDAR